MRRLLTPAEVASMFAVDVKTVTRWANAGRLPFIRTIGGHRRYPADQIHALVNRNTTEVVVDDGQLRG